MTIDLDEAERAAERCYYEVYHGDEHWDELVPKFQQHIQAAIKERDSQWREAIVPGNEGTLIGNVASTPEGASGLLRAREELHHEDVEDNRRLRDAIRTIQGHLTLDENGQWSESEREKAWYVALEALKDESDGE